MFFAGWYRASGIILTALALKIPLCTSTGQAWFVTLVTMLDVLRLSLQCWGCILWPAGCTTGTQTIRCVKQQICEATDAKVDAPDLLLGIACIFFPHEIFPSMSSDATLCGHCFCNANTSQLHAYVNAGGPSQLHSEASTFSTRLKHRNRLLNSATVVTCGRFLHPPVSPSSPLS